MKEQNERKFKGIWIPAEIWESEGLSLMEKCLIAEVDSLSTKREWCTASNGYLAKLFGCTPGHIANMVSSLSGRYLKVVIENGNKRRMMCIEHTNPSSVDEPPLHPLMNPPSSVDEPNRGISKENSKENTPPAVGEPPTSQETPSPLNVKKEKKGAAGGGAENEPRELATVFDLARMDLLKISGMDWKQAKEHKNLKELVAALGRKAPPKEGEYDLPTKKRYLRKFLEIASADDFIKKNFTPSILYSMMNKIFTEYELKKQEVKKVEEMPYHQKFDHQTSGFSKELASKKRI